MSGNDIHDVFSIPIAPAALLEISTALRDADVFTPTFSAPEVDLYDAAVYLQQTRRFGVSTRLLVDRNLLTRWAGTLRGDAPSNNHRLAAAALAFAQVADIDLEPNIALYELADHAGQDKATEELLSFRVAEQTHPRYWADVALGLYDSVVPPSHVAHPVADLEVNFAFPLRRWRRNYILALKLAELELNDGTAFSRMAGLIEWMYRDFLLSGPAIALSALYLAPNAPRQNLLKGIRSRNRRRAVEGARNAAWDLTLVSQWLGYVKEQEESGVLTLLGSLDKNVHFLARTVVDIQDRDDPIEDVMETFLVELWGHRLGRKLSAALAGCYSSAALPDRQINQDAPTGFIDSCIRHGEEKLLAWRPRSSGT